jgi:sialate O-acetylesterase
MAGSSNALPQPIPQYGTLWLRKNITLSEPLTEPIVLELGRAVDAVQVYVNGYKVIDIGYQYPPCRCELPPEMLIDGENLITVRLTGNGNPLKFIKGKRYVLSHNGTETDLQHGWQYRTGCEMERLTPGTWFFEIPTAVYYTMLAPVIGYGYDGCIWYQGESNTSHPDDYEELFTAFIEMLRLKNGCGLPVVFTQLPYYDNGDGDAGLNAVRDAQKRCLKIPGTAMADCYDAGEWNDIHPQDKLTVGRRLAEQAKRFTID